MQSHSDEAEWPPVAKRIREARTPSGLTEEEMAHRLGLTYESYCDLELFDDEVFSVLSLAELKTLGEVLSAEPRVLLVADDAEAVHAPVTFEQIAERLRARMRLDGTSAEQLSEAIGWDVAPVLADPEALWEFNVVGLYDICKAVQLDWVAALPMITRSRGSGPGS
jgi:hypothetical protein